MDKVFPADAVSALRLRALEPSAGGLQEGRVEKVISPGVYQVALGDGAQVRVRGGGALRVGDKVRVGSAEPSRTGKAGPSGTTEGAAAEAGLQWWAMIPLGFGGRDAKAELRVYVEKKPKDAKEGQAAYFIFSVTTEGQGEIQWSVYLRAKRVALQVYARLKGDSERALRELAGKVEKALRDKGYVLEVPTVFLAKPFRVPAGFRLNVRG